MTIYTHIYIYIYKYISIEYIYEFRFFVCVRMIWSKLMAVRINSGQRSAEEYFQLDSAAFSCVQLRSAAFSCQWRANLIWRWKISQKKKEKEFACGLLFWLLSCSLFPIWRKRPKTVLDMVSVHWLLVTSLNSYVAVGYLRHQYWYFNLITALLFSFFSLTSSSTSSFRWPAPPIPPMCRRRRRQRRRRQCHRRRCHRHLTLHFHHPIKFIIALV